MSHCILTFGKYRGKRFDQVDGAYLGWLLRQAWLDESLADAVSSELLCRYQAQQKQWLLFDQACSVQEVSPRTVFGVDLSGDETALFDLAMKNEELILPPWLPASSPLSSVWTKFCVSRGRRCRIRLVSPLEVGSEQLP